jgi:uncharacterized FlaG/YvyC family protein
MVGMEKYKIEIFNSGSSGTIAFESRETLDKVVKSINDCIQDLATVVTINYNKSFKTVILPKQYLQNSIITVYYGEE